MPLREPAPRWLPRAPVAEAVTIWAVCFGAIVVAWVVATPWAKVVATLGFLYLPLLAMRQRGEDFREMGVSTRNLGAQLKLALAAFAVVGPLYTLGFWVYVTEVVPRLPPELAHLLSPFTRAPNFGLRLPPRFLEWVIDQLFVVALPEEFFYRGYLQTRLRDAWPQGRVFLGGRLGKAFWVTQVLFALGHLAQGLPFRTAVFFPALIFGWMRERTGGVVGAAVFHALCNLLVIVLQECFFPS
ncbi:MAG: CPBP family intramembrane metalloprotease [Myxococcaceae bacterium]|nr:CPBP family intramembrane metalloprotease [Myxococcaceae bacterium]